MSIFASTRPEAAGAGALPVARRGEKLAAGPDMSAQAGFMHRAIALARNILLAWLAGLATTGAVLLVGFIIFAQSLQREEPRLPAPAEGIVALTGGSDRVFEAGGLLAQGQAQRMLITGVNRATRGAALARLLPMPRELFDCCVDLGYEAQDTAGNAIEIRDWAHAHDITRSLIVVTSNYHMPRALAEIGAALPDVTLAPYAVVSEHVNVDDWMSDARVTELVASEYLKYLGALLRLHLSPERPSEPAPELRRSATAE